jgi:hypothetical protein
MCDTFVVTGEECPERFDIFPTEEAMNKHKNSAKNLDDPFVKMMQKAGFG